MKDTVSKFLAALRPTPSRVYNLSVLAGIALVGAGVVESHGRAAALVAVGTLVLAFALLERLLALKGMR